MKADVLLRALPLCCLFLGAADQRDCTIHIVTDNGEGEGEGDEGEGEGDPGEGEGEGEGETCQTDADCGDNQFCALETNCPPCTNGDPACEAPCTVDGRCVDITPDPCSNVDCGPGFICEDENGQAQCVPVNTGDCRTDSDCGPNAFCDFSQCGAAGGGTDGSGGSNDPTDPNGGGAQPAPPPCDTGTCVELPPPPSCLDVDCGPGFHCVEADFGAQCVPDGDGCTTDDDCGPGSHCETFCGADPNCPNCDVCVLEGQCVQDACPELCGPGGECVVNPDGSFGCVPVTPPNCTSDADCNGGTCNANEVCLPDPSCAPDANGIVACTDICWGFCQDPPPPPPCQADSDCRDGEICELTTSCPPCANGDPACDAPCLVQGQCVAR